jgi:peptidoglycan/LPS O-acetylase OafA/YrhL
VTAKREERIGALDGVRGLAIAAVVLFHYTSRLGPGRVAHAVRSLFSLGWAGVDLFFVLSGFLITRILLESRGRPRFFRDFYARRALRIVPVYYAVLFILFFVLEPLAHVPVWTEAAAHQGWWWGFAVDFWLAIRRSGYGGGLDLFWTLSVEEQFYLVWPLVVWRFGDRALRRIVVALLVLAPVFRVVLPMAGVGGVYVLPITRMDAIAAGAFVALLPSGDPDSVARRAGWIGAGSAVVFAVMRAKGTPLGPGAYSAIAIGFAALVAHVVARPGALARALAWSPLRGLGTISYALYAIHQPVVVLIRKVLSPASSVLVGLAISLALATASWHLYEKRWLRLRRYF